MDDVRRQLEDSMLKVNMIATLSGNNNPEFWLALSRAQHLASLELEDPNDFLEWKKVKGITPKKSALLRNLYQIVNKLMEGK